MAISVEPRRRRAEGAGETGQGTRERLLAAAAAACVERGFEGATVSDIARRAEVSPPAIYNHFGSKDDLMVAAGRWALDQLRPGETRLGAPEIVRAFLADGFEDSRRLLAELHLAGHRHPRLAQLLEEWHFDHSAEWLRRLREAPTPTVDPKAVVATFFTLLLGLCQVDSLASGRAAREAVARNAERMVRSILPEEVD